MIYCYAKLVNNSATAQGWAKNDAGQYLKMRGKWCYFYADGSLAKNTKVGNYEVDKNSVRKTK